jgi:polar amino acid transport system substrate-binding protein
MRNKIGSILILCLFIIICGAASSSVHAQTESNTDELQTTRLRVVTKEIEPFVFTGDELRGFSIDLWQELARAANLEYEFVVVDTVTEQLEAVARNEVDAAIAAISITQAREEFVDFSFSYFDSGLGILTATSDRSPVLTALRTGDFLAPLLRLFGFLVLVIVLAGHVIWLLEHKRNEDFPQDYLHGIWEGIWWAAVTVTTVGYGDKTPRGRLGRFFGLVWMFAGLFIIANFTASVTTQLTMQQIQGTINGPQDLPGKAVATVAGSTADVWLTEQRIPHRKVTVIEDAYDLLESGSVQAVVYDYPVLRYHALNFGNGRVEVVGAPFNEEDYGIALASDSPLREQINRAFLQLREDGTYDRLHSQWFGR